MEEEEEEAQIQGIVKQESEEEHGHHGCVTERESPSQGHGSFFTQCLIQLHKTPSLPH